MGKLLQYCGVITEKALPHEAVNLISLTGNMWKTAFLANLKEWEGTHERRHPQSHVRDPDLLAYRGQHSRSLGKATSSWAKLGEGNSLPSL